MSNYQPVTVEAARDVADRFSKSVVAIVAWDPVHGLAHTTTYGRSPNDKVSAARLGEILATAAGLDLAKKQDFEDFRHVPAAVSRAAVERLTRDAGLMEAILDQMGSDCFPNPVGVAKQILLTVRANRVRDAEADTGKAAS